MKTNFRKLTAFFLAFVLTLGLFGGLPGVKLPVSAATATIGPTGGKFIAPIEPILDDTGWTGIKDRIGLEAIRSNLNGKYYLKNDIDLSDAD
jgi:hypothetical protein